MSQEQLAAQIVELIGGYENIKAITHCVTRLRIEVVDVSLVQDMLLNEMDDVLGTIINEDHVQIVVGAKVKLIYDEIQKSEEKVITKAPKMGLKHKWISNVLEAINGCFGPVLVAITGAGMINALLVILLSAQIISIDSRLYMSLSQISGSVFVFLPLLVALAAATYFKCNPYLALTVGWILWVDVNELTMEHPNAFLFSIVLMVWFLSYVDHLSHKWIYKNIKAFTIPLLVLLIVIPVSLFVLNPLGLWIGNAIINGFMFMETSISWLVPLLFGVLFPLFVLKGAHYLVIPLQQVQFVTLGYATFLMPVMLISNVCQGAACFAMALRFKAKEARKNAVEAGISALLAMTEPALYTVNSKYKWPLYAAMIGGGIGSFYIGLMNVRCYGGGGANLLGLIIYIGEGTYDSLIHQVIGLLIGVLVTFCLTLIFAVTKKIGD